MNPVSLPLEVAFLLDIDGTLVDLAPTPETVSVPADLPALLQKLVQATNGATALISGRGITGMRQLFPDFTGPMIGQHGGERLVDGVYARDPHYEDLTPLEIELRQRVPRDFYRFFENKGGALAIHTENNLKEALLDWLRLYCNVRPDFAVKFGLISGHRVVEIKANGFSKGTGCAYLMSLPAFQNRMPVYCGDDATDRDGFAYVQACEGLAVGIGPNFRDSSDINLAEPALLRAWLNDYVRKYQTAPSSLVPPLSSIAST